MSDQTNAPSRQDDDAEEAVALFAGERPIEHSDELERGFDEHLADFGASRVQALVDATGEAAKSTARPVASTPMRCTRWSTSGSRTTPRRSMPALPRAPAEPM